MAFYSGNSCSEKSYCSDLFISQYCSNYLYIDMFVEDTICLY